MIIKHIFRGVRLVTDISFFSEDENVLFNSIHLSFDFHPTCQSPFPVLEKHMALGQTEGHSLQGRVDAFITPQVCSG